MGCRLPNNHLGLCQIQVTCSRRTSMKEKAQLAQQEVLWQEIKMSRSASAKVALARANSLIAAEQAGAAIVAPKGNKAQWHANFAVDEFATALRDVPVVKLPPGGGGGETPPPCGLVALAPGQSLADLLHMLRVEHGFGPHVRVSCHAPSSGESVLLTALPPPLELLPLLPDVDDVELRVSEPL
mmetsp:Transcript_25214/g.83911  ORF Transcript_25214/g.83911 Transcript_25214/m.83911 type:complete len:184 (+) Transcript_25214:242-793(+)